MATLTTVTAALVTKIEALGPVTSRMVTSQYRDDLDSVAAGQTRYQIRGQYESDDGRNSQAPKKAVSFVVEFHHKISVGVNEKFHLNADMVTLLAALTGVAFWKTLAGVFEVRSGPDQAIDVRRDGNVISYGVGTVLVIDT